MAAVAYSQRAAGGDEPETLLVSLRRLVRRLQSADKAGLLSPLKLLAAAGEW
jgi:hypothetical protein